MAKMKSDGRNLPWILLGVLGALVLIIFIVGIIARVANPPEETVPTEPEIPANPYAAEQFYYNEDGFIQVDGAKAVLGVDVSEHQGDIDWEAVKAAGVEFAMIRVGYRGYDQGGLHMDNNFLANMKGASEAGLDLGVYFYSQATTPAEAKMEAAMVVAAIDGFELTYPVVYDWEYIGGDARTADMTAQEVTDCTIAFCEYIREEYLTPAFYFNQALARSTFKLHQLTDYDFWLAQYSDAMTFDYDVRMWQYTNSGSVPGIRGDVDIDLCFVPYGKGK